MGPRTGRRLAVALSAVATIAALVPGTASAAASWSAPQPLDPPLVVFSPNVLSCASDSFCAAVGYSGNVSIYDGSSWSTPTRIDATGNPIAVSCVSQSFCLAVDNIGNAFTYDGHSWTESPQGPSPSSTVEAVSCVEATFCMAIDTSGGWSTYNGEAWTSQGSISGASALRSLSCESQKFCAAVGGANAFTYNGTNWTEASPAIDPGGSLQSVSCVNTGSALNPNVKCLANGFSDSAFTYAAGQWSSASGVSLSGVLAASACASATFCELANAGGTVWSYDPSTDTWGSNPGSVGTLPVVDSLSCAPNTTYCVTVGNFDAVASPSQTIVTITPSFGSTSSQSAIGGPSPTGLSCPSEQFCVADDDGGSVEQFNGSTWTSGDVAGPDGYLDALSCVSSSFCATVDGFGDEFTFNGKSWAQTPSFDSTGGQVTAVSCASAAYCVAVDTHGYAVVYDGKSWNPVTVSGGSLGTWPLGGTVSCPTTSFCATVDTSHNTYELRGTTITEQSGIDSGATINQISCTSASFCVAVDINGDSLVFNGKAWSMPAPVGGATNGLSSLSCATATFCVAVDGAGNAFTFNGTSWTETHGVDPTNGYNGAHVACPSVSLCVSIDGGGYVTYYRAPPANTAPPTISGGIDIEGTLHEHHGTWTGGPTRYSYQWLRCNQLGDHCVPIKHATGQTFQMVPVDVGFEIRVAETATNAAGTSAPAQSAPTDIVSGLSAREFRILIQTLVVPTGKNARIHEILKHNGYKHRFNWQQTGTITIGWYQHKHLIATGTTAIKNALPFKGANATIRIKLTKAGRRLLTHARKQKLTGQGTFTPTGLRKITAKQGFTLKR